MNHYEIAQKAEEIVKHHVLYALGAGLVPIPFLDIAAVTAVQIDMLKQLARLYQVSYYDEAGKGLVTAITGSTVARIGASMLKAIPGIGSILGGVSMSVMSGASTYAVGQVFKEHFTMGGNMSNVNMNQAKDTFKKEYEKGKKVAKEMEKDNKSKGNHSSDDLISKLEQLADLKNRGIISEEEFTAQKKRLLDNM